MISSRSLRSPRSSKTASKTEAKYVFLYKFDFREEKPERIKIPRKNSKDPESLKNILDMATKCMNLPRPAKTLYDENNNIISKFSEITPNMNIYVSCIRIPTEEEFDTPIYKSNTQKSHETTKSLPKIQQPEYKPKPENSEQHIAIAASRNTVKENLRDSMLALYNSLSPAHKEQLPCSSALQKLSQNTQQYMVEDSLLTQFIGPTTVIQGTPIGQQVTEWAMERLKGLSPEKCKFAISGPSQSGKSTILNMFVSLLVQKLQIANESQNYIIFPINWQIQQIYIEDIAKLYSIVVATTLNAIKTASMRYAPIIGMLEQWLNSVLEMQVLPSLPPNIQRIPDFPSAIVQQLAAAIHKAWNSDNGFEEFIRLTFELPNNLAKALGFKSAIYVFDHFDTCCVALFPPERFAAGDQVSIPYILSDILDTVPFFVASLNDDAFFKYFAPDCIQLTTEHIITDKENVQLILSDPSFNLTMDLCSGCPGYCAMFAHIVEIAKEAQEKRVVKGQFAKLRSVVDISRQERLKQEFSRLCLLIKESNDDAIDGDVMTLISEKDELEINVH